jgi:hypothetical protein
LFAVLAEHKAFTEGILKTVMCDFEKSLISAVSSSLPWTEVSKFLEFYNGLEWYFSEGQKYQTGKIVFLPR